MAAQAMHAFITAAPGVNVTVLGLSNIRLTSTTLLIGVMRALLHAQHSDELQFSGQQAFLAACGTGNCTVRARYQWAIQEVEEDPISTSCSS